MSFDMPEITPLDRIVSTSVYNATLTIRKTDDIKLLRLALQVERLGCKRATLIRALVSKIKKLENGGIK